ncbi:MAG TPA: hypothetical protein VJQ52_21825, partial [Steroidobacteraceae bacterium]|nr:hypothetical protein [Steroidobacteraceae bacterium]
MEQSTGGTHRLRAASPARGNSRIRCVEESNKEKSIVFDRRSNNTCDTSPIELVEKRLRDRIMGNQAGKVAPNERQTPVFQLNRGEDKMNRSAIGIGLLALTLQAQESTAAQQDAKSDENLEEVVVVGRAQKFYRVESAETATKTPTDFLSIPQAVTVLNHQLIEDLAATKITDLYRSISGVTEVAYAGVTLRGFRQE